MIQKLKRHTFLDRVLRVENDERDLKHRGSHYFVAKAYTGKHKSKRRIDKRGAHEERFASYLLLHTPYEQIRNTCAKENVFQQLECT